MPASHCQPSAHEDDHPHDACGIIGVYAPEREVARLAFFGLYALQHRGQESAGIASSDGQHAYIHKDIGLVAQVFNEDKLKPLRGHLAIGHTRYSTTGSTSLRNAQPYLVETIYGPLGIGHNGNLTNALELRQMLLKRGVGLMSSTDTEIIAQILAAPPDSWPEDVRRNGSQPHADHWIDHIRGFIKLAEGAYSLVILTRDAVYAVRDPVGLRPLCLGKLEQEGYVVASESCALNTIGADYIREIEPGEIVRLDSQGVTSVIAEKPEKRALCVFEYVYFSRPDSFMDGRMIHQIRQAMGRQLAREAPADADIVIAVPDSAVPAAIGYSLETGLPYMEGLVKNRYIGRTFIQPDDRLRKQGVKLKFNPLTSNLEGKRVVLIDDSIVRGTTSGPLVQLVRSGGATEIHMRISSPQVRFPCFMGVDMATFKELIGARLGIDEVCKYIGADSLGHLSLEGMLNAVREIVGSDKGYCAACFSGEYPVKIPEWLFEEDRDKTIFETMWDNHDYD